ncbi:hypothetical protein [Burkholderia sp. BE17]|uniref:hypothetical protein n=1 Tax=Burkholderia sp. BE17 TaxID=2656644 RepID=UPI00128D49DF|nr:hypothetical protein [Burkholderia sp. BE17]MPV69135.1 hypothetical protein [Burkholderia sp. BE17]
MSVTVTLHIFSGRPDPAWELSDDQALELADRINRIPNTTLLKPSGLVGSLGYRGFSVNSVREKVLDPLIYIHGGIVDRDRFDLNRITNDADLEEWLLGTAGNAISDDVRHVVRSALSGGIIKPLNTPIGPTLVPPYDPGKWNNDPNIRMKNNCYNYANDKITNTIAQPGRGSGTTFTSLDCGNIGSAAQRDGLTSVASPASPPAQGHYVALVIWPGNDFHWYRQDSNTKWSHKPGQTPARNTDNAGELISDPRTCNRGPYSSFCGFYHCVPANTRIQ